MCYKNIFCEILHFRIPARRYFFGYTHGNAFYVWPPQNVLSSVRVSVIGRPAHLYGSPCYSSSSSHSDAASLSADFAAKSSPCSSPSLDEMHAGSVCLRQARANHAPVGAVPWPLKSRAWQSSSPRSVVRLQSAVFVDAGDRSVQNHSSRRPALLLLQLPTTTNETHVCSSNLCSSCALPPSHAPIAEKRPSWTSHLLGHADLRPARSATSGLACRA